MEFSPDSTIVFEAFGIPVNATIFNTWVVMAILVAVSLAVTWRLHPTRPPSRLRTALEVIVTGIDAQISGITYRPAMRLIPFVGTLFLFIAVSNSLLVVPGFDPPTASLSTTTALALSVLIAVPIFGISQRGIRSYLHSYIEPTVLMLPFNVVGEASRVLALAIRLYGNIVSGVVVAVILLGVAPFFFPLAMDVLGLLIGLIQAYIFAVLATVYIAAASGSAEKPNEEEQK